MRKKHAAIIAAAMLAAAAAFALGVQGREQPVSRWENGEYRLNAHENRSDRGALRLELEKGGARLSSLLLPGDGAELESLSVHWLYDSVQVISAGSEERSYMLHSDGEALRCEDSYGENICAVRAENGPCLFSLDAAGFIDGFNIQRGLYGCDTLPGPDEAGWRREDGVSLLTDGAGAERCTYKIDPHNGLEPEIALYSAENGALEAVAIGFENHGYTQWGTLLSKERAFFAMKALLPEERDSRLWEIYEKVYPSVQAAENYTPYGEAPEIARLFVYEQLGLFTYFSGGISWLCLIPADELLVGQLDGLGTELVWLYNI